MVQVSSNFTQLVDIDPALTDVFFDAYAGVTDLTPMLFGVRNSTKSKETDLRIGSFADPLPLSQAGTVQYDTADPDYEIEYVHTELARGFSVTRAMLDDMQYDAIFDSASNLGTSFARKRQKDAMSVFNNAFTAGTTAGYDSVALCSASHPRSKTDSTAVSNTLTLALNSTNLKTAKSTLKRLGDDRGEEITIMPDVLLVPEELHDQALELTGSELTPESANNAINVHNGMATLMSPLLTDANAWFVIDSTMAMRYLKWYNRVMTEFAVEGEFDTFINKYRGYMRYSFGWSDFRWVVGSNPS